MLDRQVNKLVLSFRLNKTGSLRADLERKMSNILVRGQRNEATDHLYRSLNVNLTIEPQRPDLVNDHVDNNEGSCSANSSRAMNNDGTCR